MSNIALSGRTRRALLAAGCMAAGWTGPALAQDAAGPALPGIQPVAPAAAADAAPVGAAVGFWRRPNMLGDMGGLRTVLGNVGITLGLNEVSEVLGNVSGGLKQGATYDGVTTLTVQMDTQKAFGWAGGTVNVSALQLHGRNLSQYYLDNLQTASGIGATPTTRFWEIWYQQSMLDGKLDVKLGQQSIDQEFMTSTYSSLFVNTMMGWPMLPSADLYAGGPAYPLSSLGVRLRANPVGPLTLLAGVFQDNPPGGPFNDDGQLRGTSRFGANFNLRTGALFIAEAQYAVNQPSNDTMASPAGAKGAATSGLPGTYKIGAWFDTAGFPDQRFATNGLSLADPASSGVARTRRGNVSLYALADQMVWQPDPQGARAVGLFARVMGAPGDRNLIDLSLNAGVTLKAPLPGRDNDSFGVGYGFAHVSGGASGLDRDTAYYSGGAYPVRSTEHFIEVTYQAQITPWLQIQPDFQYVFHVGGGIQNPDAPPRRIGDEAIFGARSSLTF
jgi:porin